MITIDQIRWGEYSGHEGPYFLGSIPYVLPERPEFLDKVLKVITTTEGGTYDSFNGYDSCVISVGLIQLCEKLLKVTDLLAECAVNDLETVRSYLSCLPNPAGFKKNPRNLWRITLPDGRYADSPETMQALYFGGATGLKGSYTDAQREHAKSVAVVFASMWGSQSMQVAQVRHLKPSLESYVMPRSRVILSGAGEDGFSGALRAAFMSYAANTPAVADRRLVEASSDQSWASASAEDRFTIAMKSIVFGSRIGIWPGRYKKIRPVLEDLFNVTLPSLEDLAGANDSPGASDDFINTVKGVQEFLIRKGYDLGPRKADGVIGSKTRQAIVAFQGSNGLLPDSEAGSLDHRTLVKMLEVWRAERGQP